MAITSLPINDELVACGQLSNARHEAHLQTADERGERQRQRRRQGDAEFVVAMESDLAGLWTLAPGTRVSTGWEKITATVSNVSAESVTVSVSFAKGDCFGVCYTTQKQMLAQTCRAVGPGVYEKDECSPQCYRWWQNPHQDALRRCRS